MQGKSIFRVLTNWNELQAYFNVAQPASTQSARYKARTLLDMLKDPIVYQYFQFVSPLTSDFERVNAFFQATDADLEEMFPELDTHHKSLRGRVFDIEGKQIAIENVDFWWEVPV